MSVGTRCRGQRSRSSSGAAAIQGTHPSGAESSGLAPHICGMKRKGVSRLDTPKQEFFSYFLVFLISVVGQKWSGVKLKANEAKLITFHSSKGMKGKKNPPHQTSSLISNPLLFRQNYFAHPELINIYSALLTGYLRWKFPTETLFCKIHCRTSCLKTCSTVCW